MSGAFPPDPRPPVYTVRGAPPRPLPAGGPAGGTSAGWRPPLVVVALMLLWLLITSGLSCVASSTAVSERAPVDVGRGVVVTPAPGWAPAGERWEVGPDAVSFMRAGALLAFAAEERTGTAQDVLQRELDGLRDELGSFQELPMAETTVADEIPAISVLFSGTSGSRRLEGQLVVGAADDTVIVMLAVAPFGQLAWVKSDIDTMLNTLVVPR